MRKVYCYIVVLLGFLVVFSACEGTEDGENNSNSSKTGAVVTVHVCNATTKVGHYVYRVVIKDNFTDKYLLDQSVSLKNGAYKDFQITSNPKYQKNNWKITVYAKGGYYGNKSNYTMRQPYSKIKNKVYCYWHGTYISDNYGD